jgi:hypothetical protein
MADDYRSYVIRVRRHAVRGSSKAPATRLDIEDLLAGGTATVSGETARAFADSLERLVESSSPHVPPGAEPDAS